MPTQITLTAGEDIKIGSLVTIVTEDANTSEPLSFVYTCKPGYIPSGIAMTSGKQWDQIEIAVSGEIIRSSLSTDDEGNVKRGIAGENLEAGFVQLGKDGRIYNGSTVYSAITRYVVAGTDLAKGQRVIFDEQAEGYILAPEGQRADGLVQKSASAGMIFPLIVGFYKPSDDTFISITGIDDISINGD